MPSNVCTPNSEKSLPGENDTPGSNVFEPAKIDSTTFIVKLALPVFPAASDALHTTVELPTENNDPDDGLQFGPDVTPTLSVAVALTNDTVVSDPVVTTAMSSGVKTIGAVVSSSLNTTVIVKLEVLTLSAASLAVQVTTVSPTVNKVPDSTSQVGPDVTVLSSVAVTVP